MKVLNVIVGLLFVLVLQVDFRAIAVDVSQEFDADDEACIAELHLNIEKIAAIDMSEMLPESDEEFVKFMECSGKKQGYISPEGEIVYPTLHKGLFGDAEMYPQFKPEELAFYQKITTGIVDMCHQEHVSGTNSGATLIKVVNCVTSKLNEKKN